jgi:hypothetical protein
MGDAVLISRITAGFKLLFRGSFRKILYLVARVVASRPSR